MSESARRVLIADEDRFVLQLLETVLKQDGFRVATCRDGGEAARMSREEKYDILLLSTHLPTRSGVEVVEDLRTTGAAVPVVLLSGNLELLPKIKMDGVYLLSKPFTLAELRALIARALTPAD